MKSTMLISRLLQAAVVLVGVSMVVFLLVRILPGDPVRLMAGEQATEEQIHIRDSSLEVQNK